MTHFVVEDIKAAPKKGQRKWNKSFSPLETGKNWFYGELKKLGKLSLMQGYETYELRANLRLKKTSKKMNEVFEAHCVDSWALANHFVGGHTKPDNTSLFLMKPIQFHRRQLHVFSPTKDNKRKAYGGTRSLGLKRGSLVKHLIYGLVYIGGSSKNRITIHDIKTSNRISRNIRPEDCTFLSYNSWRSYWP